MYGTTLDHATAIAESLNASRIGCPALFGHGRTATRYEVRPHRYRTTRWGTTNTPETWGVVERWTYDDKPDLGEFGGTFVWVADGVGAV